MALLSDAERRDFWDICQDRNQVRSLILKSAIQHGPKPTAPRCAATSEGSASPDSQIGLLDLSQVIARPMPSSLSAKDAPLPV